MRIFVLGGGGLFFSSYVYWYFWSSRFDKRNSWNWKVAQVKENPWSAEVECVYTFVRNFLNSVNVWIGSARDSFLSGTITMVSVWYIQARARGRQRLPSTVFVCCKYNHDTSQDVTRWYEREIIFCRSPEHWGFDTFVECGDDYSSAGSIDTWFGSLDVGLV